MTRNRCIQHTINLAQLLSSRRMAISCSSSRMAAATGIATSAPAITEVTKFAQHVAADLGEDLITDEDGPRPPRVRHELVCEHLDTRQADQEIDAEHHHGEDGGRGAAGPDPSWTTRIPGPRMAGRDR